MSPLGAALARAVRTAPEKRLARVNRMLVKVYAEESTKVAVELTQKFWGLDTGYGAPFISLRRPSTLGI